MTKTRFDFDANTVEDAKVYIQNRAKQLLRHFYFLDSIVEFDWGVSAYFKKDGQTFQSIYILKDFRGKGIYKAQITHMILTSYECGLEGYLIKNNIPFVIENLTGSSEYNLINTHYNGNKANRSGVYLMNHIDEGLYILNRIGASETAKKAYCIHPIVQSDEGIAKYYGLFKDTKPKTIIAAIEYRSVANEYLSKRKISSIDEIRLSPLKDVNDMLIADKIQNRKDFDLYHKGTHERSNELTEYFDNWFKRLGITDEFYQECLKDLK